MVIRSWGFFSDQTWGSNTEATTYGFRISDARGFEFGKNDFGSTFFKVNTNGNVGIGTSNPGIEFDVRGRVQFHSLGNTNNFLHFDYDSNGNKLRSYGTNLFLETRNITENIEFRTNNSSNSLMIVKGNGNVGIGTTDPQDKLQVRGNLRLDGGYSNDEIRFESQNGFHRIAFRQLRFYDWDGGGDNLTINNGSVGIGTTTPDAKLAVNGNIHAKEVKVDLVGWPDYVFENTYELPTLNQVETHIKEKGHLQNIPSAQEVAENGIELGEMNKKLLEKIEELTLYTIAQEKELNDQEKRIRSLENKLEKLLQQ
ncbi:hypothetical protein [Aquimarina spongiae]|uniref:Chaperone of endosialidase n=1 Tax=Aquimarina spongiae TaxID=570521 RepID=A0A1M6A7H8_9FLAO|nr:hypothetical protein [Aquimarina spongiae]SHI32416.1 hypothetical protein SAMN04488508_101139 [Aquimarina spongiae]